MFSLLNNNNNNNNNNHDPDYLNKCRNIILNGGAGGYSNIFIYIAQLFITKLRKLIRFFN